MTSKTPAAAATLLVALACTTLACGPKEEASQTPSAMAAAPAKASDGCSGAAAGSDLTPLDRSGTGSAIALGELDGTTLAFIADEDDEAIHVVDVDSGKTVSTTLLDGRPSQLLVTPDGRLAALIREHSTLTVFDPSDPESLRRTCAVETAAEPVGIAMTPDRATLVVASDWGQMLATYDAATLKRTSTAALPRSAKSVVVADDGTRAFVSHAAGARVSVVDLASHEVSEVPLASRHDRRLAELKKQGQSEDSMRFMRKSLDGDVLTSCQGFALAKTSAPAGRVLAPHVMVDPGEKMTRTRGYGHDHGVTELPAVAVIDTRAAAPLGESMENPSRWAPRGARGELLESCILPRSAAVDDATQTLLVGCFGIDSVVAYDAASASPGRAEVFRWRVASGPSGIAVDGKRRRAFVWSQFDRTLNTLDLSDLTPSVEKPQAERVAQLRLPTTKDRELTIGERLGRRLFHATQDSRIALDGRACASCHPDGRDDGLVWSTPNGPRRTIMLSGRVRGTAPYGWSGDAIDLDHHLDATFERLGGVGGLRSVERDALVAYLERLQPPPLPPAEPDPRVARGKEVFDSPQTGCATCHGGETLSDQSVHDVGSKSPADPHAGFETPSLRFIASRGPYFHDGRYGSLRELLVETDGAMGNVGHLSTEDLEALEAYLRTL